MKSTRLIIGSVLLASSVHAAGLLGGFFDRSPDVIVNTNVSEAGAKYAPASPKQPVYIEGLSLGFKEYGQSIAGEHPPSEKDMIKVITKILYQQGYRAATAQHPATQYVIISWGTYRQSGGPQLAANGTLLKFMGGDKLDLMWESETNPFINPRVLLRGMRDGMSSMIMNIAAGDIYLIAIKSFDLAELKKEKIVALWETKIACPANGLDIAETLPVMVVAAAPMIGKEMKRPVWLDEVDKHKATVTIGEDEVVEVMHENKAP